ncbi:MAG: sigma-70 family RNA polymerase sigma factor [Planctomycetes bacterium]|nr:sigma-70 family RNA polymerase sigma factor [Planctomycetota bacterium]
MATSFVMRVATGVAAQLLLVGAVDASFDALGPTGAASCSSAPDRSMPASARTTSDQASGLTSAAALFSFSVWRKRKPLAAAASTDPTKCPVDVVRRAQLGDERAFTELWRRYAPTVNGILLTMVTDAEADDLTQEVAVAALRSLPSLEKPESFPAWLCTIARNMGRDALKAKRARHDEPIENAVDVDAPPTGDGAEADEIVAQIRALPECYREPMMLRLLLEMSGPEIAEQTGMTPGSVRVNLCRGMKLLRERLKDWV